MRAVGFALVVALAGWGCQGKSQREADANAHAVEASPPSSDNPSPLLQVGASEVEATKSGGGGIQASPVPMDPVPSPGVVVQDPLGLRFRDPPWFRRDLFDTSEAIVVDFARSDRDANGLFKSHLLFEFLGPVTLDACAGLTRAKLAADVGTLQEEKQDDKRIRLTGSTARYRVAVICGDANGKTRAYLGYEWTS